MNNLDDSIREALEAEGDEWMHEFDEQWCHEQMVDVFRGKSRLPATLGFVVTLIFLVVGVFSAVQFFRVESSRAMIGWATGFLFCCISISMIKIWYWLQMSQNAMTREIKRFELQLARLSGRLDE